MDPRPFLANLIPTVLVVDDEMLIRWALAEILASAGFAVVQAGTAREALDRLDGHVGRIAVALLDLRLPDSTDFSLLRRIRVMHPGCKVILMTADGTPGILEEAIGAGAFRALAKPFDMNIVAGIVRQAAAA